VCVVGVSFLQRRDNNKGLELLKWEGKKQVRDVERERDESSGKYILTGER
jgi:hypothetical protein